MARENCLYCGAALPPGLMEEAAQAAQRVLQSRSLTELEAATTDRRRDQLPRRYIVFDTTAASVQSIAAACSVSLWDARQWQAASRYRLVKVSTEPEGPLESRLRDLGLTVLILPEETVARARHPIRVESIDTSKNPAQCTLRKDTGAPPTRMALPERDVALVISGSIRRETVKDLASRKNAHHRSVEDIYLAHLHLKGESGPWEIDPDRTVFEGAGLPSAHMRTLHLVRRLSAVAPHDEAFKNVVPALAPGHDPLSELSGLRPGPKRPSKEGKSVVLDNRAQFREYSAWRGALALFPPPLL